MKMSLVTLFVLLPALASADVTLPIVGHPERVDKTMWKPGKFRRRLSRTKIPAGLLETVTVPNPSKAFQAPYSDVFLQDDRMVVCYDSCKKPQSLRATRTGSNYTIAGDGDQLAKVVRQTNVYYWVGKLFDRMATLGFKPTRRLVIYIDRNAPDLTSGEGSTNNAFFSDVDWTLSFLPSAYSLLTYATTKTVFSYSANDPSVILHETTHSVFEALIGSILNAEIYGLHEAFADYFSMTIRNEATIGAIMGEGVPLRTGEKLLTYKTGMEAHKLGNVVMAGLWNIRALFKNPIAADRIALETIRKVSKNVYASAGDVVAAHLEATREAIAADSTLDPGIVASIQGIWNQTGLKPTSVRPNASAIGAPKTSAPPVVAAIAGMKIPAALAAEYGYPVESKASLKFYGQKPISADGKESWMNVSTSEVGAADKRLWVYYDAKSSGIYAAVNEDGVAIDRNSGIDFGALIGTGGTISAYAKLIDGTFADAVVPFFDSAKAGKLKYIFKRGPVRTEREIAVINGIQVERTRSIVDVEPSNLAKFLARFDAADVQMIADAVTRVEMETIEPGRLGPIATKATMTPDGKIIVGYRITTGAGAVNSLELTDLR